MGTKVAMEKEEELNDEQEKVCRGFLCKLREDPEYRKVLREEMDKAITERLAKVIQLAEVEMESAEFKAKKKENEFNKKMLTPLEEDED